MARVIICNGAGFGDEGKGSVVDFLTRKHGAHCVIRYNGGAQAAHNVVDPDGRHHTFAQFGAGTFAGARTHLSRFMLVNPIFMLSEGKHLVSLGVSDAFQRVTVDGDALVTTPFHVALNRVRELCRDALLNARRTGEGRHGSCGMGIGETVAYALANPEGAIRFKDLSNPGTMMVKLGDIQDYMVKEANELVGKVPVNDSLAKEYKLLCQDDLASICMEWFAKLLGMGVRSVGPEYLSAALTEGTTIFEGAQGVLLDEEWGFHPYTTRSNCTFENALQLVEGFKGEVTKIGVLRAYHTRHGAGPFPTESPEVKATGDHNGIGPWQEGFRAGYFDFVLARYARLALGGVDEVALCHLDQVQGPQKVCLAYAWPNWYGPQGPNQYRIHKIPRVEYEKLKAMFDEEGSTYQHPYDGTIEPVYTTLSSVDRLISGVERTMRAPVTIRSYGPRAGDKQ